MKKKIDLKNCLLSMQSLQKSFPKLEQSYLKLQIKNENLQKSYSKLEIRNENLQKSYSKLINDYQVKKDIFLADFKNTNSWKITKPLRYISREYKKGTKFAKKILSSLKPLLKRFLKNFF